MKKNKILPSIRITSELDKQIRGALKKLNENDLEFEIKESDFRRFAYKHLCDKIKIEGLEIQFV